MSTSEMRGPANDLAVTVGARRINNLKVVEAPPGAPLPEGVPTWAFRCEVVDKPDYPPVLRPWILGASVIGIVGGMLLSVLGRYWGFVPVPLFLLGLYLGLSPPKTTRLVPAADGPYVAYDDSQPGDHEQSRVGSLLGGVVMLCVAGYSRFAVEQPDWYWISALAAVGAGFVYYGLTGRKLDGDEPYIPPATDRFRALADPTRPLEAPVPSPLTPPAPPDG